MTEFNGQLPSKKTLWWRAVGASDLESGAKLVAWAIGCRMNADARAYPSRKTIAEDAGVSTRTVDRLLPEIEDAGLLRVRRSRGGQGVVNRYVGTIPTDLWDIWAEDLIEQLVHANILDEDDDYNGDVRVTVASRTVTSATGNGDIRGAERRHPRRETVTPVSPEVGTEVQDREVGTQGSELPLGRDLDDVRDQDQDEDHGEPVDEIVRSKPRAREPSEVGGGGRA